MTARSPARVAPRLLTKADLATEIVSDSAMLVSHKRVIAEREQTIETLRAENEALQKECEEQNASRCELIQANAKLRADNERLRATFQKCQIALLFCDDYFDETPAIVQDALSAMDDQQ